MDNITIKPKLNINGTRYYLIEDIKEQFPNISTSFFQRKDIVDVLYIYGNKTYIDKTNFQKYFVLANIENEYYPLSMVLTKLSIYRNSIRYKEIETILCKICSHIQKENNYYFLKKDVDDLIGKCNKDYFVISYLLSLYLNKKVIYTNELIQYAIDKKIYLYNSTKLSNIFLQTMFGEKYNTILEIDYIEEDYTKIDDILKEKANISSLEMFNNYVKINDKTIETYELLKNYFMERMNKCNSINYYKNALKILYFLTPFYRSLFKEIYMYSKKDLFQYIFNDKNNNNKEITHFLEYVKTNTNYNFGNGMNFVFQTNNTPMTNDCYSKEDWFEFYDYINNVDKHINNAYENRNYAQYWLLMIICLSSAIRPSDIFNLPIIGLENTRYILKDELKNNRLSISESQSIVNMFRKNIESTMIIKTSERKHFYIVLDIMETLATAICINEYHRVKEKDTKIFTFSSFNANKVKSKFKDIPIEFSPTKATKTLLSLVHNQYEKSNTSNAYSIVSTMRAHKHTNSKYSETTTIYLQQETLKEDLEEIAYNICNRGVFGWLYLALLQYANGTISNLEEATTRINELEEHISPSALENLAGFLNNENKQRKIVLNELSNYSKDNIKTFLSNIGNSFTTSKKDTIYCTKGTYCKDKSQETCLFCPYAIPTTYTLELIELKINELLNKMENVSIDNEKERMKYSFLIQKLLLLLIDARNEFKKYGNDFVGSFIDLKTIQYKLQSIPNCKFIETKDEVN